MINEHLDNRYFPERAYVNEAADSAFSLKELSTINTFRGRLRYCLLHLGDRWGSGSARTVFDIDDETVLKLALNEKGITQNEEEAGQSRFASEVVVQVRDCDDNYTWLVEERCIPAKKSDFKQVLGVSFETVQRFIITNESMYKRNFSNMDCLSDEEFEKLVNSNDFFSELEDYMGNFQLPSGDLCRISSWGMVKRDGEVCMVVLDAGLSQSVWNQYYGIRRGRVNENNVNDHSMPLTAYSWDGEMWGRAVRFYSLKNGNTEDAVVVIKKDNGPDELHFHMKNRPSEEEMDALLRKVSSDYKDGDLVSSSGNGSPGGIHGLLRLKDYGFNIDGYSDDPKTNRWGETHVDKEKFDTWMKKHGNEEFVGRNTGGTYPKYPVMRKGTPVHEAANETDEKEYIDEEVNAETFLPHDSLNDKLWKDDDTLNPRVRLALLDIADDFVERLNIKYVKPSDIVLTGSLANYNWNEHSDVDVHVVMDFSKVFDDVDVVKSYFDAQKYLWNGEHKNLRVKGFPVELCVEDEKNPARASGVYSLNKNEWIKKPQKMDEKKVDAKTLEEEYEDYKEKLNALTDSIDREEDKVRMKKLMEELNDVVSELSDKRKAALKGEKKELSNGNLLWKMLRADGIIKRVYDKIAEVYDKVMSVDEGFKGSNRLINSLNEERTISPYVWEASKAIIEMLKERLSDTDSEHATITYPVKCSDDESLKCIVSLNAKGGNEAKEKGTSFIRFDDDNGQAVFATITIYTRKTKNGVNMDCVRATLTHEINHLLQQVKIGGRSWRYPVCGEEHDRDHNAAINILCENERIIGFRRPEFTPAESPTVDDRRETDLRSSGSSKQEGRTCFLSGFSVRYNIASGWINSDIEEEKHLGSVFYMAMGGETDGFINTLCAEVYADLTNRGLTMFQNSDAVVWLKRLYDAYEYLNANDRAINPILRNKIKELFGEKATVKSIKSLCKKIIVRTEKKIVMAVKEAFSLAINDGFRFNGDFVRHYISEIQDAVNTLPNDKKIALNESELFPSYFQPNINADNTITLWHGLKDSAMDYVLTYEKLTPKVCSEGAFGLWFSTKVDNDYPSMYNNLISIDVPIEKFGKAFHVMNSSHVLTEEEIPIEKYNFKIHKIGGLNVDDKEMVEYWRSFFDNNDQRMIDALHECFDSDTLWYAFVDILM